MKLISKIFCASAMVCFTSFVNAQTHMIPSDDESYLTQCDGGSCFRLVSDDESSTAKDQEKSSDAANQDQSSDASSQDQSGDASAQEGDQQDANDQNQSSDDQNSDEDSSDDSSDVE